MKKSSLPSCFFPNKKKWAGHLFHAIKFLFFIFLLIPAISIAQPVVAPVNPPTGGFNIDGTLRANTAAGDWTAGTGAGGYVLQNNAGTWGPVDFSKTTFTRDGYGTSPDHIFDGGKFGDNPNTKWTWKSANCLAKCDIGTGLIHTTTSSNSKWVILGGDRFAQSGTSYIDFQFSQGNFTKLANGTFSSLSATNSSLLSTGGRTVGDFVLSMEYTNGGALATVHYYRWELAGSAYKYIEYPIPGSAIDPSAFGRSNTVATEVPYEAFGSTTYQPFAFAEAAVNIDAIIGNNNCQAITIRSVCVTTKSSDAYSADLKDFVDPQPVSFQFGSAGLIYGGPDFCKTGTLTPTAPAVPQGNFTATPDGLSMDPLTGVIDLAASPVGSYTVTYTPSGGVCLTPATATVNVNAIPTITLGSNPAVCRGTTSASLAYTATTGTPNKYSINFDTDAETAGFVDVTDANLPSSPISITVPAAAPVATYNGTLTVKTAAGCVSTGNAITVRVNPNPTANAGTAPTAQCAGETGNDFNLSGSFTHGTALWTVQSETGTADGSVTSGETTATPVVHVNGIGTVTFLLTVTSDQTPSCGVPTSTVTVTVNPNPTANAGTAPTAQCAGATGNDFNLSGSFTNGTALWTVQSATGTAAGSVSNGGTTATPLVHVNGVGTVTFLLTVTSNQSPSCGNATSTVTVTVNANPSASVASITLCESSQGIGTASFDLTSVINTVTGGAGGVTVTWFSNAGLSTSISSPDAYVSISKDVFAKVTNNTTTCSSSAAVTLTVNPRPAITTSATPGIINLINETTSQLGVATISPGVIADYNYSWIISAQPPASNASLTNATTATPTLNIEAPHVIGTYTAQVTATNISTGCSNTSLKNVSVSVGAAPDCEVTGLSPICPGTTNTYKYDPDENDIANPLPDGFTAVWSLVNNTNSASINGSTTGNSVSVISGSGCGTSYTIKITITSASGLVSTSCEKIVTVNDVTPPTFTSCPADIVVECDASILPANTGGSATATDNCSSVTPTYEDAPPVNKGCVTYITRTWTAADACGNTSICIQRITKRDRTAPEITCPETGDATATDNCSSEENITIFYRDAGGTRTWTAIDESGNMSTCTQPTPSLARQSTNNTPENSAAKKAVADKAETTVKAYPNPFNGRVKFLVTAPQAGYGTLELMNMQGQKLKTIYSGQFVKGGQLFEMEVPALRSATLIYVFRMGDKQITGKLVQLNQ